jgi:hypothetical protein
MSTLASIRLEQPDEAEAIEAMRAFETRFRSARESDPGLRLSPRLTEDAVARFERDTGVALPRDLRWFVLNVGAGFTVPSGPDFETLIDAEAIEVVEDPRHFLDDANRDVVRDLQTGARFSSEVSEDLRRLVERYGERWPVRAYIPIDVSDEDFPTVVVVSEGGIGHVFVDARGRDLGSRPFFRVLGGGTLGLHTFASWLTQLPLGSEESCVIASLQLATLVPVVCEAAVVDPATTESARRAEADVEAAMNLLAMAQPGPPPRSRTESPPKSSAAEDASLRRARTDVAAAMDRLANGEARATDVAAEQDSERRAQADVEAAMKRLATATDLTPRHRPWWRFWS